MIRSAVPPIKRKNIRINQETLDEVKAVLGAHTETEAVARALDLVLFRTEVAAGLDRIIGTGGVEDVDREGG